MHQTFAVHTTQEKFENATIICYPKFVFEENSVRKSRDYHDATSFEKLFCQNVFRPHENENPAFSNSSCLEAQTGHTFIQSLG